MDFLSLFILIKIIIIVIVYLFGKIEHQINKIILEKFDECDEKKNIYFNSFEESQFNYNFVPDIEYNFAYEPDPTIIKSNLNDSSNVMTQLYFNDSIEKKNTCFSYSNEADCWENNFCEWDKNKNINKCVPTRTMLL